MEISVEAPQKTTSRPHDPAISLLHTYLKECKSINKRDTCIPMFIGALFIIAKLQNQPRRPISDEWRMKINMVHTHTHTMEYCSAIKKNEIMSFAKHGWNWRSSLE
jgi:hypothetical protein